MNTIGKLTAATAIGLGTLGTASPAKAELPELVKHVWRSKPSSLAECFDFEKIHNNTPNWPHKSAGYILLLTGAIGAGAFAYGAGKTLEKKNKS